MINERINPKIKSGATVRVFERVTESGKERIRRFEGLVLARKHGNEPGATFTVRSTVAGVGVEKVFPVHSPSIDKVEVLSSPKNVRRSKIYYVRNISRKLIRKKTAIKDDIAAEMNRQLQEEERAKKQREAEEKKAEEEAAAKAEQAKAEEAKQAEEEKPTEEAKEEAPAAAE